MTLSNEPGYYEDGKFGIRIENIVIVQPCVSPPFLSAARTLMTGDRATTPNNFGDTGFLRFENVTMVRSFATEGGSELLTLDGTGTDPDQARRRDFAQSQGARMAERLPCRGAGEALGADGEDWRC